MLPPVGSGTVLNVCCGGGWLVARRAGPRGGAGRTDSRLGAVEVAGRALEARITAGEGPPHAYDVEWAMGLFQKTVARMEEGLLPPDERVVPPPRQLSVPWLGLGFLLGTIIGGLIGWYGGGDRSRSAAPAPPPPPPPEAPAYATQYFSAASGGVGGGGPPCPSRVTAEQKALAWDGAFVASVVQSEWLRALEARARQVLLPQYARQFEALCGVVPPLSMVVSLGNSTLFDAHIGHRNASDPLTPTPDVDTVYQVGSVSKVLTTLGFFRQMEAGAVGLLDPVSRHLPGFAPKNPYSSGQVTMASLSSQTSGLARETACGTAPPRCSADTIIGVLSNESLAFPPQSRATYSNLGLALLGHAWAAASSAGGSFEEQLLRDVTGPLNMSRTGFFASPGGSIVPGAPGPALPVPAAWPPGTTEASIRANMALPGALLPAPAGAKHQYVLEAVPDSQLALGAFAPRPAPWQPKPHSGTARLGQPRGGGHLVARGHGAAAAVGPVGRHQRIRPHQSRFGVSGALVARAGL